MSEQWAQAQRDFGVSVFYGSMFGGLGLVLWSMRELPDAIPTVAAIFFSGLTIGIIASPFVAVGLAFAGVPFTHVLREHLPEQWVGVLAAFCSAVAGWIFYEAIDSVLQIGMLFHSAEPGIAFGVPTALAWWSVTRPSDTEIAPLEP